MIYCARITLSILLLASLLVSFAVVAEDPEPDATIEIQKKSFGFIIKGATGTGTLFFQGQEYPFTIRSVGVGGVGVAAIDLTGNVYNLKDVKGFPGTYSVGRAGLAVGVGQGGVHMANNDGVELWLRSSSRGVSLQLGVDALTFTMAE